VTVAGADGGVVNVYVDRYWMGDSGASGPRLDRIGHTRSYMTNTAPQNTRELEM
jgi:hypothetical protein